MRARMPSSWGLLHRRTLLESPKVVFYLYPPNAEPKPYLTAASLLLVIRDL